MSAGMRSAAGRGWSSRRPHAPITAVVPAYNREREVGEALESILAQSLPVAEILVIDDGSVDRTASVAKSLGARVISQDNRGVSAARNAGILAASQEWIAFLDSDDVWEPAKISMQWSALELAPDAGVVFTDHEQFDLTGTVRRSVLSEREAYRTVERTEIAPHVVSCDRLGLAAAVLPGNLLKPSTLLARRDLLIEVGMFQPGLGHGEDRELALRLLARTSALAVERPLVRYRVHPDRASADSLKMLQGAATIAGLVFEHPERYPPGAVEYFRTDLPGKLHAIGVVLMEQGRFREARGKFAESLRRRRSARGLAAWLVALGGAPTYRGLVRVKRRFNLAGLRP